MRSELFEEAWKQNRHVWESTKCLAQAMYLAGEKHQQPKVDELQKRVDDLTELNRLKTIALQQSVNRTSPYVHEKIVALEQALKGGEA